MQPTCDDVASDSVDEYLRVFEAVRARGAVSDVTAYLYSGPR